MISHGYLLTMFMKKIGSQSTFTPFIGAQSRALQLVMAI